MKPETLKKCLSGNASKEEWAAYQQWLEGMHDDEDDAFTTPPEAATAQRIWQQIQDKNQYQNRILKLKSRVAWISVAATILLISYLFLSPGTSGGKTSASMVFKHDNERPFRESEFDGIRLQLGTNSMVKMQRQKSNDIDIQLTGNMMVTNTTAQDKHTAVVYTESNGQKIIKKVCLKKGKKYLFAYYPAKEDKLLVIEDHALMDMPPVMVLNLKNDFDLL